MNPVSVPMKENVDARKTLIIIGMCNSIHFARWLQHVDPREYSVYVFNSSPGRRIHPLVINIMAETGFSWARNSRKMNIVDFALQKYSFLSPISKEIERAMSDLKPDIVHAVELRVSGYLLLPILKKFGGDRKISTSGAPSLMLTSYGSELHWFAMKKRHTKKIRNLLYKSSVLTTECARDVKKAILLGFKGEALSFPATGGLKKDQLVDLNNKARRNLATVKGYQGVWGKANRSLRFLRRLERLTPGLFGEIILYSADVRVMPFAIFHRIVSGIPLRVYRRGSLGHDQLLKLFAESSVYVGMSKTDGISTSMLEAMSQGAVPIQSSTACTNEWFVDGESGISVDISNPEDSLARANELFSSRTKIRRAQKKNLQTTVQGYDFDNIGHEVKRAYETSHRVRRPN